MRWLKKGSSSRAFLSNIKKALAEGKLIIEKPAEKAANDDKKPEEKKADGTSMTAPALRRLFVDAILEFSKLFPKRRVFIL